MSKPKAKPFVTLEKTGAQPRLIIDHEIVKKLGSQGLTGKQIAQALGISFTTLQLRRKESKEFDEAVEEGQARGIAAVTNALFKMATEDHNVAAAIFYLKNRAQWQDRVQVENEFTLPAPLIIETIKNITPKPQELTEKAMP